MSARTAIASALALAPLAGAAAGEAAPAPVEAPQPPPISRVYLDATVGHVTADRSADIIGQPRYAIRAASDDGASLVEFSATKPMPALAIARMAAAPLLNARLTSAFGAPREATGGGWRAHAGIDLAAPLGSPVAASMDGRVARADWVAGYGLLVTLEHGGGLETRYAHLSRIGVVPGQVVHKGDVLGLVGSTGHSTGPHLHYEVRRNGEAVNPLAR